MRRLALVIPSWRRHRLQRIVDAYGSVRLSWPIWVAGSGSRAGGVATFSVMTTPVYAIEGTRSDGKRHPFRHEHPRGEKRRYDGQAGHLGRRHTCFECQGAPKSAAVSGVEKSTTWPILWVRSSAGARETRSSAVRFVVRQLSPMTSAQESAHAIRRIVLDRSQTSERRPHRVGALCRRHRRCALGKLAVETTVCALGKVQPTSEEDGAAEPEGRQEN